MKHNTGVIKLKVALKKIEEAENCLEIMIVTDTILLNILEKELCVKEKHETWLPLYG